MLSLYPYEIEAVQNVQEKVIQTKLNKFMDIDFPPENSSAFWYELHLSLLISLLALKIHLNIHLSTSFTGEEPMSSSERMFKLVLDLLMSSLMRSSLMTSSRDHWVIAGSCAP